MTSDAIGPPPGSERSGEPNPPARAIFIIRHGEKPEGGGPPYGVNINGERERSESSLTPRGWQRAGALARLFAPFNAEPRSGLRAPEQFVSPLYPDGHNHRTYQTIMPLAELLGGEIQTSFKEGDEQSLAQYISHPGIGTAVICWDHKRIPVIALNIFGMENSKVVPEKWCDDRFDVVWAFVREQWDYGDYVFSQIPQMLLYGDSEAPIPVGGL